MFMVCVAGYAESCVNEGEIVNVLTIKNMMCYTCMCKVSTRCHIMFILYFFFNQLFLKIFNIIIIHIPNHIIIVPMWTILLKYMQALGDVVMIFCTGISV